MRRGIGIGVASWLLGNVPLAERVRWAAESGFDAVSFQDAQLVATGPYGLGPGVERIIRKSGLEVTIHPTPPSPATADKRAALSRAIARAAELQRRTGLVRSIGIDPVWVSVEGVVVYDPDGTQRVLEEIVRAVDGLGVAVAVENWKINPERDEFLRLARALHRSCRAELGLLLDLGHLHVMTDDPVRETAELPLPVREVHVSDNDGREDDHLPLGRGTLPIEGIARELAKKGFDGVRTLEVRARYSFAQCTVRNPKARKALHESRDRLARALAAAAEGGPQRCNERSHR